MKLAKGWVLKNLEELAKFSQGIQVDVDNQFIEPSKDLVRFLRISDFVNKDEIPRYVSNPGEKFLVSTDDLSMIRYGSAGAGDLVRGLSGAIANNLFRVMPIEEQVSKDYLWVYLRQEKIKHFLFGNSTSSTMPAVSFKLVGKVPVQLPPLPEQRKIAAILSTWDKAITTTEQLLANSQQQKKALMQQLLTGKKRLLDENGERFRGEWKTGHLSDLAKITKGKALSSKDLIEGDFPVIAGGKTSPYKHKNFTHQNVITVSASGAYAGYVAYHNYKLWASDCSVIDNKVNSDINFIYQLMTHLQTKIYSLQSGGAQPHVYPKDLEVLKVTIPCLKEQQKIADLLTAADKGISALQQKIEALKQEKKALMQQLLTGKRRVKIDEVAA